MKATATIVLALAAIACTRGEEGSEDAGAQQALDGGPPPTGGSGGAPPVASGNGGSEDAARAGEDGSAADTAGAPSFTGRWLPGPCHDDFPCVVAGFDPIVDLGPGVENCVNDGRGGLVMIGRFHRINGVPARKIARWDGHRWAALGDGLERFGEALAFHDGHTYAAGAFRRAGTDGVALSYVGQFDGESWRPLGDGFEGEPGREGYGRALTVWNGQLIAGGNFTRAGGKPAAHVARWDGAAWNALGDGTDGPVHALSVYGEALVATGKFTRAGSVGAANIALWDGGSWHALGAGLDDQAFALAVHHGDLYVTGDFTRAGDREARHVARWDGNDWHPLGSGLDGPDKPFGRALATFADHLVVSGNFLTAGGVSARRIAAWTGTRFEPIGQGLTNWVEGLTVHDGRLVACGWFNNRAEGGPLGFGVFGP